MKDSISISSQPRAITPPQSGGGSGGGGGGGGITTVPPSIAYTNPNNGISQFANYFSTSIYSNSYTTYGSLSFYLPIASYVDMKVDGNLGSFYDQAYWSMYVDTDYLNYGEYWPIGCSDNYNFCYMPMQTSRLTYLSKGWHTLYIEGNAGLFDTSDNYYANGYTSIVAYPEYTALKVLVPNGGQTWYRGQTYSITWAVYGQPGANVKIELYQGSTKKMDISSNTPNDGIYSWSIPTFLPTGTNFKIKISSTSDSKYYDLSDNYFKIY